MAGGSELVYLMKISNSKYELLSEDMDGYMSLAKSSTKNCFQQIAANVTRTLFPEIALLNNNAGKVMFSIA